MAIMDLSGVKAILGITDSARDDQIIAMLEPATALVERLSNRKWTNASRTERHEGGVQAIPLRVYPVSTVTTVTDKLTGSALASSGYEVEAATGLLYRLPYGAWWDGFAPSPIFTTDGGGSAAFARWEIVYTGGPATVPGDVQFAFAEIVSSALTSQGGMQSEKDGDYSYTRAPTRDGVPPSASAVLMRYAAGALF